MKKLFHSPANSPRQKILFFKSGSLLLTVALLVSAIFAPGVSAAEADVGYDTKNTTVYSSIDAVTSNGIAESNKSSRWKFAVSTTDYNDFFAVTTNDFEIDASADENGGVTITWTAPEGATGEATVKISDGASYNRSFTATGSSYTSTEFAVGSTYQIQVIMGDYTSEVFSYGNIMLPVSVQNQNGDNKFSYGGSDTYTRFLLDFKENKKYINDKAGLLVKIDMSIINENVVTFNYQTTSGSLAGQTYSSEKAWVAFDSNLYSVSEGGDWKAQSTDTSHTVKGSNNAYIIDTNNGIYQGINNNENVKVIGDGDLNFTANAGSKQRVDENTTGFRSGYLLIPFDHYNAATLTQMANNGYICYITERYNYWYYTQSAAGTDKIDANPHIINFSELAVGDTINGHDNTYRTKDKDGNDVVPQVRSLFDREISIGSVTLITDYAGFVSANVDTENKSFSAGTPKSTTDISDGGYMTATGNNLSSLSCETTGKYTDYNSGYSFTVAYGETAKIGFTAPVDGYYEISDKLTAAATAGASYRVVRETADGDRMLLQETRSIDENGKLVLLAKLDAGDTVYIEAYANTANGEIGFAIPKAVKINNISETDGSYVSTPVDYYVTESNSAVYNRKYNFDLTQQQTTWQFKWFLNPVSVTNGNETIVYTEEECLKGNLLTQNSFGDSIVDYDTLGIEKLEDNSDATKFVNALRDFDYTYDGCYYISKLSATYKNTDDTLNYSAGGRDHTRSGFLSLVATSGNAGAVASKDATKFSYSVGFARGVTNVNTNYYNMGIAFEWTAPAAGTVNLSGIERFNDGSQIILKNLNVVAALHKDKNRELSAITVEKGDVITIAYSRTDGKYTGNKTHTQQITFTPSVSNITVTGDTVDTGLVGGLLANGTEIKMPEFTKQGTLFRNWEDSKENPYNAEDIYTVDGDDTLKPIYSYYGDLNGDYKITAPDLAILRKHIIGVSEIEDDDILLLADVNADDECNLLDLIRMKKYIAGYNVVLGAE